MNILEKIVKQLKIDLQERKASLPIEIIKDNISFESESISLYDALSNDYLGIISEIKDTSPSKGKLMTENNFNKLANDYLNANVDAISIVTEKNYFNGKKNNIPRIKSFTNYNSTPILRKDFIVDEYQIYESKLINADAILLIASILNIDQLKLYSEIAYSLDLDVIIEVHNELELDQVLKIDPKIIGINNRDLSTFKVDLNTTLNMINKIPVSVIKISESGIYTSDDMSKLYQFGCNAVLIGESIITSINPYEKIKELRDYD